MRRSLVFAAVLALARFGPAPASAGIIDPGPFPWTIPALIPVVGHDAAGTPDPRGEVLIVIRDLANTPIPGSRVILDFSFCSDLSLCSDPHDPDAVVNCVSKTVTKFTDMNGEVRFRVVGCSSAAPGSPGAGAHCARIYADGVLGGFPNVAIYDLTGCDGLHSSDLGAWLTDFFSVAQPNRADYDGDMLLGGTDLSLWLAAFFASNSILNCAGGLPCP